ncbi:MAG: DUF47 domain-containing protein [Ignavibacteriaceae bacterium]
MGFSLLPKEYEFFNMFDKLADQCISSSKQFRANVDNENFNDEFLQRIKDIEHAADSITFDIFEKLNKTFITPFDREDIFSLAHEFDSVIDLILKISNMMKIYNIDIVNKHFVDVVKLIDSSIFSLCEAVKGLRNLKNSTEINKHCAEVNRLENLGDQLRNEAIAELFTGTIDAIYIMKWKDIFQTSEKILDQCDDVAKIIGSLIVKQA